MVTRCPRPGRSPTTLFLTSDLSMRIRSLAGVTRPRLAVVLAATLTLVPAAPTWAAGQASSARPPSPAASAPVTSAAVTPPRKPMTIPPSSIIVAVRRAYVFGQGRDRYCSPEISVFNQANRAVSTIMIAAEYTQTVNGVTRKVGNTHTRFTLDAGDTVSTGFYRLATDSCDQITARASVSVCLWRDRSECQDRVVFSDSGQIPMLAIDSDQ